MLSFSVAAMTSLPTTRGWPYTAPSNWALQAVVRAPAVGTPTATPVRAAFPSNSGQLAPVVLAVFPGLGVFVLLAVLAGEVVTLPDALPEVALVPVQAATMHAAAARVVPRTINPPVCRVPRISDRAPVPGVPVN